MKIVLENRWAYVVKASDKELEFLREFYSFFAPAARYDRRYKLYMHAKWKAEAEGRKNVHLPGWDGKIRMFDVVNGRIPAGLFRATREELETTQRVKVRHVLPKIDFPFRLEATEPEGKYLFQSKCVTRMHKATRRGGGIVLSATGSGKTKMAADYFRELPGYSCLFVVDTIDLLHQSAKEIGEWLGEKVGVVGEGEYQVERVTVATSQTLDVHKKDKKFRKWFEKIQIVLVDELHEQMGKRNFKILETIEPISVIGLTATLQLSRKPIRFKAHSFCGPVIFRFPISEATEKNIVTRGAVIQLLFPYDETYGFAKGREGYEEELKVEVLKNTEKLRACRKICKLMIKRGGHVLVLADRITHVDELAEALPQPNRAIRGAVKRAERESAKKAFERGKVPLLIASKVFKKGTNIRICDRMVNMAEGGSKNDAIQAFGRSVRLHGAKTFVVYVDIGTDGGRFGKRAMRRRKAFKAESIPLTVAKVRTAGDAFRAVKTFLESVK